MIDFRAGQAAKSASSFTCNVTIRDGSKTAWRRTSGRSSKQGIRAVAARAGVSTASVSRALNSPDSVSAELRARIARSRAIGRLYPARLGARAVVAAHPHAGGHHPDHRQHHVRARHRGAAEISVVRRLHAAADHQRLRSRCGAGAGAQPDQPRRRRSGPARRLPSRRLAQDARRQCRSLHQCRRLSAGPSLPLRRRRQ